MQKKFADLTIEIVKGNIVAQPDVEAIVNAANARLVPGGGVDGAIHRAAGPQLAAEVIQYAPINPGQAVITQAYNLPNNYVIHCLGPVYGRDKPENKLLADCYINTLKIADEEAIESIAFPAISTGVFGYPKEEAAAVSLKAVSETAQILNNVKLARFILFSDNDLEVFNQALKAIENF